MDQYGQDAYGAPLSYRARVQGKIRKITTVQGEEAVSTITVYVAGMGIVPQDRLTLPSPFVPAQPKILDVGIVSDENGSHHTVLYA